jgi:predicted transcriptional regulator
MAMEEKECEIPHFTLKGEDLESYLGPLEAKVLETMWVLSKKPATVRDCYEVLNKKNKIAYTSVMSTMDRLYSKGFLERSIERGKGGLYYVYWPTMSKQEFNENAVKQVLSSLVSKYGKGMVASCLAEQSDEK